MKIELSIQDYALVKHQQQAGGKRQCSEFTGNMEFLLGSFMGSDASKIFKVADLHLAVDDDGVQSSAECECFVHVLLHLVISAPLCNVVRSLN